MWKEFKASEQSVCHSEFHSRLKSGRLGKMGNFAGSYFGISHCLAKTFKSPNGSWHPRALRIATKLKRESEARRSLCVRRSIRLRYPRRLLDHLARCVGCWRRL